MRLLYLIGQPGAGKTTLLARCLDGLHGETSFIGVPHIRYYQHAPAYTKGREGTIMLQSIGRKATGIQLGRERDRFGGTDTLALNIQPLVVKFLDAIIRDRSPWGQNVVAEGDRLANAKFFNLVREMGIDLTVACLVTPDTLAAARREERGSQQNESWLAGRRTKVLGLKDWVDPAWWLDGTQPVDHLAGKLTQHPVLQAIRGQAVPQEAGA